MRSAQFQICAILPHLHQILSCRSLKRKFPAFEDIGLPPPSILIGNFQSNADLLIQKNYNLCPPVAEVLRGCSSEVIYSSQGAEDDHRVAKQGHRVDVRECPRGSNQSLKRSGSIVLTQKAIALRILGNLTDLWVYDIFL